MLLQPLVSALHKQQAAMVSDIAPATRDTQPDPLQFQSLHMDSEDNCSPGSPSTEPTLASIMLAIQDCKASLTAQIASVCMDFFLLKQDVQNLGDRAGEAEERISSLEDVVHPLSATVRDHTGEMAALCAKIYDMENRSRRNNLRFVGFLERAEGPRPEKFLYNWLREIFGSDAPSFSHVIERAHRTPPHPPPSGAPPCSIIAQLLNFQDKVAIFHLDSEKGPLKYNGNTISVYPDFSADVQRQRISFAAVKA